ncbi:helix-turn-helix domain-containing protein [Cellulomonas rhizosphaerae]|uniref:DNA-binding protein n=1 Tax=Cellulomonas rhizosphaerae TaxID=2293719 RepID=A0A413RJF5_9CELL|nr:helix-turn-helix domain-containing protein [Cellulomonas rhizosphaerae]RHA38682.1 DNA-binding protein [Cellulomonas rhizosphaerae]
MSAELLTVPQVADRLGLTEYQVRQEHARGVLPGRRPGRFLRFTDTDLETYVARIAVDRGAGQASGPTRLSHTRRRRSL